MEKIKLLKENKWKNKNREDGAEDMASVTHAPASISEDFNILCDKYTRVFALM